MERFYRILLPDGSLSPRGAYDAGHPGLLWTNVVADGLLAGAFFVIALIGLSLVRGREKTGVRLLWCGALFAGCCGLLHALQAVAAWWPAYWLAGMLKGVTALAALAAAAALLVAAPAVRTLPTRKRWERTSQTLRQQDETIRQSQEARHEAEERYGVLKQLFDGTIIHVDRHIVFANPAAARLLGAAHPEELVGRNILSFAHPDYQPAVQDRLAGADHGRAVPLMEQKIVRLDGQVTDIEATAAPVTYGGKPAVQSILRDITERNRQENRLRLLTKATHDVIWDADLTTGLLWWNENYKKLFGYAEAEADAGLSWYGRMHPDDAPRVAADMQQAEAEGQRQWRAEYRFRRADGEYADVLDRAFILHDGAGKPIRAIGSMVDVTALKKTRAELALAEERFQLVAKATNDFVYDWNMPDDAMWWNEQFRDQFGYREADLRPGATAWTDRLHPDDRTRVWDQLHEAFREGHTQTSFEYRFRQPDGTYAYILERGYILYDEAGVPVRMVGSMADLSPLRKALEELKKRNYELDTYVYKVSHDLRAPLASILGLINILKEEQDLGTIHHYVALMENRARKLDVFIQSILAHSRTSSTEVQVGPVCFDKVIRESFEDLRYLPRFDQVKLIVKQEGGEMFYSDELKVSIVLKNFLSNAIKYSNPQAAGSFVDFAIRTTPTEATIVIHDNGIGIEPQYVDRIFDMFFRGTEKSDGSGLGLYIVKQTIEKLGGSIAVESYPGQGTMFRIVLPNLREQMA